MSDSGLGEWARDDPAWSSLDSGIRRELHQRIAFSFGVREPVNPLSSIVVSRLAIQLCPEFIPRRIISRLDLV
jgi:hypothetical protein